MEGGSSKTRKPHALVIPFPTQGHINPFLKLAKILHARGFHITFVNTEFNHKRLLKSKGSDAFNGFTDFCFETIPDGLPLTTMDATQNIPALCESTDKHCLGPFFHLVEKMLHDDDVPPVSCIVSDGIMSFTIRASQHFGIPNVAFWTHSACAFMSFRECKNLKEKGIIPLKDASYLTNGYLDTKIDWIPGMKDVKLRDLPGIYRTTDPNDFLLDFVPQQIEAASKASALMLPTFDALEPQVLNALSSMYPQLYTIGPLDLLLHNQTPNSSENNCESIKCNLWKEESDCLKWLDSKQPSSVLYVNFGSVIVMRPEQVIELAWGLANSKQSFIWVIRGDLVANGKAILPQEITEEIKERSLILGWCPQEEVLKHPAIGGFLTHCGWNSTIESISNGVPMICCPFFNDQMLHRRFVSREWGCGMEMESEELKRDEVERLVRELMEGEKGVKLRDQARKWKKMAQEATQAGGSSSLNMDKLVNEVLLSKS
ncbi:7-deoxyloganetin glucosyltransferase [Neltuma alba]|uniref:7-deoxyloganetin glucosyltransferase n=1 Tax=Neltuma alba TaxID=207710 RepID=UPI0010A4C36D|nr:7-deoxyloganetin glucosyltransferase-like [Prosopis alba]